MRTRALFVTAALALTAASCGNSSNPADNATQATSGPATTAGTTAPKTDNKNRTAKPYAETIDIALRDIQSFWAETMTEVYDQDYVEIPKSKIYAASSKSTGPSCSPDGGKADYDEVKNNAYYCRLGAYMQYDDENLFPRIHKQFGEYAVAMVLAHEFGHAVQDQLKILGGKYPTIVTELQADCFAGAWTKNALDNPDDTGFRATAADLQSALAGMIELRDKPGKDPLAKGAHGNGFDRVNGFQTGFEQGVERCATFPIDMPDVTEEQFTSEDDLERGGNLPYDRAVTAATTDLDLYWSTLGDTYDFEFRKVGELKGWKRGDDPLECGDKKYAEDQIRDTVFFCHEDNFIGFDELYLQDLTASIGDFGMATVLAEQWAISAQYQDGQDRSKIESKDGRLQQACFAGAWARAVWSGDAHAPADQRLTLSPGDLDESVRAFLAGSEQPDDKGESATGTAFERIAAFRDGFLSATPEQQCASYSEKDAQSEK